VFYGSVVSERTLSLFVLKLDPQVSNATLAFFFALTPLTAVLTGLAGPLADLRGKKRVMVPFYFAAAPFLILLSVVPWFRGVLSPWHLVMSTAVTLACFSLVRAIGFVGWMPLINDNVPDESRGRFFGRLRTAWQTALVVFTAMIGWFLGSRPDLWKFQVLFAFSFVACIAMTAGTMRIPEAPVSPGPAVHTTSQRLVLPLKDKSFVRLLVFIALYNVAAAFAGPFGIRILKTTLQAGDDFVVWMDSMAGLGAVLTLNMAGRFVDRFGGRLMFSMSLPPLAAVNLVWLFIRPGHPLWPHMALAYALLQGILVAAIGVGITDMILGSSREGHRGTYINHAYVAGMLAAGVGPYLGAAVARLFEGADATLGPLEFDSNRWVFVVRSVLLLTPLLLIPRLSRECGGKVGEALRRLSIHARGLKAFGR
jgi:MFS family permease